MAESKASTTMATHNSVNFDRLGECSPKKECFR